MLAKPCTSIDNPIILLYWYIEGHTERIKANFHSEPTVYSIKYMGYNAFLETKIINYGQAVNIFEFFFYSIEVHILSFQNIYGFI